MSGTLFVNGVVRSPASAGWTTDALYVERGRIAALGRQAAREAASVDAEIVDLAGGCLLPGFGDGHAHALLGGAELTGAPVAGAEGVDEVVAAVARHARENPELTWILGGPFDPGIAPHEALRSATLDGAVPDRPVVLTAADHHSIWCNGEALRRAGIDVSTPDPDGGTIARDAHGTPSGLLLEEPAFSLVTRLIPPATVPERQEALRRGTAAMADEGITWLQECWADPEDVDVFLACERAGELAVRANVAMQARPGGWPSELEDFVVARAAAAPSDVVSATTIKFFLDGVTLAGTAAMLEPYADGGGDGHALWDPVELADAAAACDARGFQLHMHAMGDRANRMALDAIAEVARRNGPRDRRPVVAHAAVVHPDDLDRFGTEGVIAVMQPLWAQADRWQTELVMPRLGPVRARRQYPMASLLRRGASLSFGSDWSVSSLRPLDGLCTATTRRTAEGEPPAGWIPEERIGPIAALAAYTSGVAYQAFEERQWGRIELGMRADLVALDTDLVAVDPSTWPRASVTGTWLGGRRTGGLG